MYYNLGSTYFRLERYNEARSSFLQIVDDADWGGAAHYNLGLVAERQGQLARARNHYQQAYDRATSDAIRQRSAAKLELDGTGTSASSRWNTYLSAAGGYEDNAALTSDLSAPQAGGRGDEFFLLWGATSRYLHGDYRDGYRLVLSGYLQQYNRLDDFDLGTLGLEFSRDRQQADWHTRMSGRMHTYWIGGNIYGNRFSLGARGSRDFTDRTLVLDGDLGYIDASRRYHYLSGWQTRGRVEMIQPMSAADLRLGYRLELNSRNDLSGGQEFFSYSPTRHLIFAELGRVSLGAAELTVGLDYEHSRYADRNVMQEQDSSFTSRKRRDNGWGALLRGDFGLGGGWHVFASYDYSQRDSNLAQYDYSSNRFLLGIEGGF